jgi:hypothetical protein
MIGRQYLLQGTVLHAGTNQPLGNVHVEIWVKMPAQNKRLGEATSDSTGNFSFTFRQCYLIQLFSGHYPELVFQLSKDEGAIALASTPAVDWEAAAGWGKTAAIQLLAQLPVPEPTYTVQGTIRDEDGSPQTNALVKAFAIISPTQEVLLGETHTSETGHYTIAYQPSQLQATGKSQADLIVRVYDPDNSTLLLTSPLQLQVPASVTVNLGGNPPEPSEYENLLQTLTPHLQNTSLAELTPEASAYLAIKTELDAKAIATMGRCCLIRIRKPKLLANILRLKYFSNYSIRTIHLNTTRN